jgi:HEPN domain-containing protein
VDFYTNAQETEGAAIALLDAGIYRQSVYMSCLAVELYLKSKLHLVPHDDELERSHDIVNLHKALLTRYQPKINMSNMITRCRKYFNESRYPYASDVSIYTKEFALEFVDFVVAVKDFIDNECIATIGDLKNKYPDGRT